MAAATSRPTPRSSARRRRRCRGVGAARRPGRHVRAVREDGAGRLLARGRRGRVCLPPRRPGGRGLPDQERELRGAPPRPAAQAADGGDDARARRLLRPVGGARRPRAPRGVGARDVGRRGARRRRRRLPRARQGSDSEKTPRQAARQRPRRLAEYRATSDEGRRRGGDEIPSTKVSDTQGDTQRRAEVFVDVRSAPPAVRLRRRLARRRPPDHARARLLVHRGRGQPFVCEHWLDRDLLQALRADMGELLTREGPFMDVNDRMVAGLNPENWAAIGEARERGARPNSPTIRGAARRGRRACSTAGCARGVVGRWPSTASRQRAAARLARRPAPRGVWPAPAPVRVRRPPLRCDAAQPGVAAVPERRRRSGGAMRAYPRADATAPCGAHDGNLQVYRARLGAEAVFLDGWAGEAAEPEGRLLLESEADGAREVLTDGDQRVRATEDWPGARRARREALRDGVQRVSESLRGDSPSAPTGRGARRAAGRSSCRTRCAAVVPSAGRTRCSSRCGGGVIFRRCENAHRRVASRIEQELRAAFRAGLHHLARRPRMVAARMAPMRACALPQQPDSLAGSAAVLNSSSPSSPWPRAAAARELGTARKESTITRRSGADAL